MHWNYLSYPISAALGWLLGERICKWREMRPRLLIDEDGNWETVNGARVPMICPKCSWPKAYKNTLVAEITCLKCGYTGSGKEFDKQVQRANA